MPLRRKLVSSEHNFYFVVLPKIASFLPVSSSFLFESRKTFNYQPHSKKIDTKNVDQTKPKTNLQILYLNAKQQVDKMRTIYENQSLIMHIEIPSTSCFNFHELTLKTKLNKFTSSEMVEEIKCHAQPNTAGKQVTLECALNCAAPASIRVEITAIHTASGKILSSLSTETPIISVVKSTKRTRPSEELNSNTIICEEPPKKKQKLSNIDSSIEELLQFDFFPLVDYDLAPALDIPNNLFDFNCEAIDLFL